MSRRPVALGVNQVFAYRLRDARRAKGWDQQQLADAMERVGHTINRATISKIEAGALGAGRSEGREPTRHGKTPARPVSLREAITFAAALDVPPASLFLPINRHAEDVELAPNHVVDVETAHAWDRGERPLNVEDDEAVSFYRFQTFARPATLTDLEELGIRFVREPAKQAPPTRGRASAKNKED
jgi:transcriptional regulator with XRE-family HTH domain